MIRVMRIGVSKGMTVSLYTINVKLNNKNCLVVGAGNVSERKVKGLLESGANITVISPEFTEGILSLKEHPKLKLVAGEFQEDDLEGMFLVIIATNNKNLNSKIAALCNEKNILTNAADNPEMSSFFVPSVVRRGDLSIAVSTGGKSPALASKISSELLNRFDEKYEKYIYILGEVRDWAKAEVKDSLKRKEILTKLPEIDIDELIKLYDDDLIRERLYKCISL